MPGEDRAYLEHVIDYVHRDLGNVVEDVRRESESLRAELRAALRRLERAVEGMRRHVDGLGEGRLSSPPADRAGAEPVEQHGPPGDGLSPVEAALLAAATDEPQTAKRLANEAGYPYSPHLRAALAALVRRGELLHDAHGYRLPP